MKISEIQGDQGKIHVHGDVIDVSPVREFEKYGRTLRVANAVLRDESGTVKLTLWNDEIGKVKKGDKVEVINGYARTYQDEIQLTAGKFGEIKVIGKAEAEAEPVEEAKKAADELFNDEDEW